MIEANYNQIEIAKIKNEYNALNHPYVRIGKMT